jgi:hypothetical protein
MVCVASTGPNGAFPACPPRFAGQAKTTAYGRGRLLARESMAPDSVGKEPVRRIHLTQGKKAVVDDKDHRRLLAAGSWYAIKRDRRWYANSARHGLMHRFLWKTLHGECPSKLDHRDRNGLNNRRSNLRPASSSDNAFNSELSCNRSGYRGVCWVPSKRRWWARIYRNKRQHSLGYFKTRIEAARAYNRAARRLVPRFARLNQV